MQRAKSEWALWAYGAHVMVFVLNLRLWWEASYIVRPDGIGLSHQAEMYGPVALRPVGPRPNGVAVLPLTRDVTIQHAGFVT